MKRIKRIFWLLLITAIAVELLSACLLVFGVIRMPENPEGLTIALSSAGFVVGPMLIVAAVIFRILATQKLHQKLLLDGIPAVGRILSITNNVIINGRPQLNLLIEYKTRQGQTVRGTQKTTQFNAMSLSIGDSYNVRYHPDEPEMVAIDPAANEFPSRNSMFLDLSKQMLETVFGAGHSKRGPSVKTVRCSGCGVTVTATEGKTSTCEYCGSLINY